MSAITSTPVVLSARARVAGSAVRAAAPARVAPVRRVQVVRAAKKGAFAARPPNFFSPFVVVAPLGGAAPAHALVAGGGSDGRPWRGFDRRATRVRRGCRGEIRARLWRLPRRLRRPRARAPRRRRVCKRHVFPTNI